MSSKIKNFLVRKKILFLVFGIIFLILLIPQKPASAAFWSYFSGITSNVISLPIAFIIFVLGALAAFFAGFAGALLHFVIGPNFTALSYTNPADNPVIKLGLGVTQGFANIILVLILIYIALATILRLAGYETKKILPRFILVALLVNFTPVLCGLIVDASNIMMNYFAQPLIGAGGLTSLITHLKDMWAVYSAGFDINVLVSSTAQIAQIFKLIAATVFYFFLALILLLYTGVFAVRYVAIWVLVILSPIAFVCLIMPKGSPLRRAWDMWWTQFIQWSIIGILKMFFLYLGIQLMVEAPNLFKGDLGVAELGWFTMILPYVVPLAFLYLGWIMSMQTTAFGASAVIGLTGRGWKWAGGAAWGHVEEKTRFREGTGKAVQAVEKVPVIRAFIPQGVRKYAQFRPAIDDAQKKANFQSSPELGHRLATGADYGLSAVANMKELVDRGDSQDIFKAFKNKYKVDQDEDLYKVPDFQKKMARYLQIALQGGHHNAILRGSPRLARFAFDAIPGYGADDLRKAGLEASPEGAVIKAVGEARSQHIRNWEREELADETVIRGGLTRGRDFWQSVASQVKKGHEEPLQTVANIFKKDYYKPDMSDKQLDEAWEKFHQDIKQKNNGQEGFFQFLESSRAKEQGWSVDRIKDMVRGKYTAPKEPTTPTPGTATGLTIQETRFGGRPRTQEEAAKRIKEREDIGQTRAKKRKEPDTGKT